MVTDGINQRYNYHKHGENRTLTTDDPWHTLMLFDRLEICYQSSTWLVLLCCIVQWTNWRIFDDRTCSQYSYQTGDINKNFLG